MLINPIPIKQTASSGAWSFNTTRVIGMLKQILVKTATATNAFNFSITDEDGDVVYSTAVSGETPTGTLNVMVNIPLRGIYTIAVANAEGDEAFTGKLMIQESD